MEVKIISPVQTHSLRHLVLWPHIEREEDCVIDADERKDAIHLATCEGERIVSIGSLFEMQSEKIALVPGESKKQYRLRAMATDPEYRGRDCGKLLVEKAIEILREKKIDVLWCDARMGAVGFYKRLGFSMIDEVYEVPRIGPHKFMWVELK
ncbi:MAG: GNAT family N-acetyltransferase [Flavobacteriales bacterium]|nr:GNAT family N-acetyltransferase [Flavobacteriales bacterium]